MVDFSNDEFMLVRTRDKAVIINRLFLTASGISNIPCDAHRTNEPLAKSVIEQLDSEKSGRVSFGKV